MILDSRFWLLDSRFWLLDSRFWLLDSRFWLLDSRFWLLDSQLSILNFDRLRYKRGPIYYYRAMIIDYLKVLQYLYIGAFFALDLTVAASNLYLMIFFYGFDLLLAGSFFLFVLVYLGWFVVIRDQEFSGFMRGNQMIKAKLSRAERPRSYWTVFLILGSFHFLLHLSYFDAAHVFSFYSF